MKSLYKILTLTFVSGLISLNASAQCVPLFGKLVINELMPANKTTATDPNGDYDDWVEIYNSTDEPINLQGYFLSDSRSDRTKFVFPDVVIDPEGLLIIWCDGQPEQGELHTNFKLSASGEHLGFYDPDTLVLDYVRFAATPNDVSIGRYPNGHGPFSRLMPTFNEYNTNSVGLGVVINEYQAINESTAQDQWGAFDDWIELYNNSDQPIDLTGYFLSDKIGSPTLFQFPDTIIEPDSYLIVWCDQGLEEPGLHAFFKLGADGDDILFSNPDTATVDYVRFGPQIPDDSEGRFGNGTGPIACMIPTFAESNGFPTSVNTVEVDADFTFYPNPAHDIVHIEMVNSGKQTLRIFGIDGKLVESVTTNDGSVDMNVAHLSSGMYIIRSETFSTRLIVY